MNINRLSWIRGVLFVIRSTSDDTVARRNAWLAWFQFQGHSPGPILFEGERYRLIGLAAELVFLFPMVELYGVILEVLCQH